MSLERLLAGAAEHFAGRMADQAERYSRDPRVSAEKRDELASGAERLRNFQDRAEEWRRHSR